LERTTDRWMRGCISNFYWTNDKLANRKRNVFSRTCFRITIFNQTSIIRYIRLQIWLHLRDDHWGPRGHHHLVLLRKEWWVTFVFFHWATATKSYNDHLFPSFWDRQRLYECVDVDRRGIGEICCDHPSERNTWVISWSLMDVPDSFSSTNHLYEVSGATFKVVSIPLNTMLTSCALKWLLFSFWIHSQTHLYLST